MKYNAKQLDLIAREIAHARGSVGQAVAKLRKDYETFRTIGTRNIYRYLKSRAFQKRIDAMTPIMDEAFRLEILENERLRVRAELSGSDAARMAEVSALIGKCHEIIEGLAKTKSAKLSVPFMQMYTRLLAIHDKRLVKTLPCISEVGELTTVITIIGVELQSELGHRAESVLKRIQKRVADALAQRGAEPAKQE